jgi:regulator of nucleoside diphosphate kinase
MHHQATSLENPPVFVSAEQYEQLHNLAVTSTERGAPLLAAELQRATLAPEGRRAGFARLYSFVTFSDLSTGRSRTIQLVPPVEADIDNGRLSVVTPVGAALLGLSPGDRFALETDDGRRRVLSVSHVQSGA